MSRRFTLAFRVTAVDTPLVQCSLAANGELRIEELPQGEFLFSARFPNSQPTCICVITLKHLPDFVLEAKGAAQQFRAALSSEQEKFAESLNARVKQMSASHDQ